MVLLSSRQAANMPQIGHSPPKRKKKDKRQLSETSEVGIENPVGVNERENVNEMPEKVHRPTTRSDTLKANQPDGDNGNRTVTTQLDGILKQRIKYTKTNQSVEREDCR